MLTYRGLMESTDWRGRRHDSTRLLCSASLPSPANSLADAPFDSFLSFIFLAQGEQENGCGDERKKGTVSRCRRFVLKKRKKERHRQTICKQTQGRRRRSIRRQWAPEIMKKHAVQRIDAGAFQMSQRSLCLILQQQDPNFFSGGMPYGPFRRIFSCLVLTTDDFFVCVCRPFGHDSVCLGPTKPESTDADTRRFQPRLGRYPADSNRW